MNTVGPAISFADLMLAFAAKRAKQRVLVIGASRLWPWWPPLQSKSHLCSFAQGMSGNTGRFVINT
jgi:hypothetical protein